MDEKYNTQTLAVDLRQLSLQLQLASKGFQVSAESKRRPAVRVALSALSNFVSNVFAPDQELCLPLNQLLFELQDLDGGPPGSLLKPTKISHRAKTPLAIRLFRAMAAALMDIYQQADVPRKVAASRAANKLNELGYRDERGQRIVPKKVESWRDELKAAKGKGDFAVDRYKFMLEIVKSKYPNEPETAAQFLLDALPGIAARTIQRKP
jgi:hypothetical protein